MLKTTHVSHDTEEASGNEAAERMEDEDGIKGKMPGMNPSPSRAGEPFISRSRSHPFPIHSEEQRSRQAIK